MDSSEIDSLSAIKTVLAEAIEHGRERGYRAGMLRAAAMMEAQYTAEEIRQVAICPKVVKEAAA